jgi:hypothetical protein
MLAVSDIVLSHAPARSLHAVGGVWLSGHVAARLSTQRRADVAVQRDHGCARVGIDPTSTWLGLVDRLPRRARRSTGETR